MSDRDDECRFATPRDAVLEYARNAGSERPDVPWILTPWDVWAKNPFYSGPPCPHPEDETSGGDRG